MSIDAANRQDQAAIEKSLAASRLEGVTAQITSGILDYYLIPFALFLGASIQEIGFLIALPNFLCALSQFFVIDILHIAGNRRRLLIWATILQAIVLAPLPLFAFQLIPARIALSFTLATAFRVIGAIMSPSWGSLMSDHLPDNRRGDYFGRRSQLIVIFGILSGAACGAMLHIVGRLSTQLAYFLLFATACVSRAFSIRYMARMADLPEQPHPNEDFYFSSFIERLHQSNFARFMTYVASITFATNLTAAYFSVHMLKDLHFGFIPYTAVQLGSAAISFSAYPLWGRHADIVGNARVIKLNSFLMPLIPLLWSFTNRLWGLILIEGINGFVTAGFNLCTTNFIYDAVPAPKRIRALGYYNLINGIAIFMGGCCGSLLAVRLPPLWGYRLNTLFLVAAVARLIADFALARHFKEARTTARHANSAEVFFSVVGLRPLSGVGTDMEWDAPAKLAKQSLPNTIR